MPKMLKLPASGVVYGRILDVPYTTTDLHDNLLIRFPFVADDSRDLVVAFGAVALARAWAGFTTEAWQDIVDTCAHRVELRAVMDGARVVGFSLASVGRHPDNYVPFTLSLGSLPHDYLEQGLYTDTERVKIGKDYGFT